MLALVVMGICGGCLDVGARNNIEINHVSLSLLISIWPSKKIRTNGKNAERESVLLRAVSVFIYLFFLLLKHFK